MEWQGALAERQGAPGSAGEHGRAPGNASELCDEHRGVPGKANERAAGSAGERQGTRGMAARTHRIGGILIVKRSWCAPFGLRNCLQWVQMEPQNHPTAIQKKHKY